MIAGTGMVRRRLPEIFYVALTDLYGPVLETRHVSVFGMGTVADMRLSRLTE
jgi:hypothetical protein